MAIAKTIRRGLAPSADGPLCPTSSPGEHQEKPALRDEVKDVYGHGREITQEERLRGAFALFLDLPNRPFLRVSSWKVVSCARQNVDSRTIQAVEFEQSLRSLPETELTVGASLSLYPDTGPFVICSLGRDVRRFSALVFTPGTIWIPRLSLFEREEAWWWENGNHGYGPMRPQTLPPPFSDTHKSKDGCIGVSQRGRRPPLRYTWSLVYSSVPARLG